MPEPKKKMFRHCISSGALCRGGAQLGAEQLHELRTHALKRAPPA